MCVYVYIYPAILALGDSVANLAWEEYVQEVQAAERYWIDAPARTAATCALWQIGQGNAAQGELSWAGHVGLQASGYH